MSEHTKVVWVTLRTEVVVEDFGYPDTAERLAEIEAKRFCEELTSVARLNRTSRVVVGANVTKVTVWEAEAIEK